MCTTVCDLWYLYGTVTDAGNQFRRLSSIMWVKIRNGFDDLRIPRLELFRGPVLSANIDGRACLYRSYACFSVICPSLRALHQAD